MVFKMQSMFRHIPSGMKDYGLTPIFNMFLGESQFIKYLFQMMEFI